MSTDKFTYQHMQTALREGGKHELRNMYQACFEDLMLYCLGKCKNREMAQDAASETLQALLEHADPQSIPNLKAWLLSVAHNKAIKMLDKKVRRSRILGGVHSSMRSSEEMEVGEALDLERLQDVVRNILKQEDYEIWELSNQGFKDVEIAERLAISAKTIANRKSLIKKKLNHKLSGYKR